MVKAKESLKCALNSATPATLCGHFLKLSLTEECKKYLTVPVLLISGYSIPQVCADPSCLSDYGTRESYATADICSPFIPTHSQATPVAFPDIWDKKVFLTPYPMISTINLLPMCFSNTPQNSCFCLSAFSTVATNSSSSTSPLKKKRISSPLH